MGWFFIRSALPRAVPLRVAALVCILLLVPAMCLADGIFGDPDLSGPEPIIRAILCVLGRWSGGDHMDFKDILECFSPR